MRPITVLYVPATATTLAECERRTVTAITDLQRLVGGYVEQEPVPATDGVVMFGDEHALEKESPTNPLATAALARYRLRAGQAEETRVAGDVVFCHYDAEGNEDDVPEAFVSDLRAHLP